MVSFYAVLVEILILNETFENKSRNFVNLAVKSMQAVIIHQF